MNPALVRRPRRLTLLVLITVIAISMISIFVLERVATQRNVAATATMYARIEATNDVVRTQVAREPAEPTRVLMTATLPPEILATVRARGATNGAFGTQSRIQVFQTATARASMPR